MNNPVNTSSSLLNEDIKDIIKPYSQKFNPHYMFEAIIHTTDKNMTYKDGFVVKTFNDFRDYVNHLTDYMEIEFKVFYGTFVYDIYPYLNNLEVTLKKTNQFNVVLTERYKATFILDKNPNIVVNTTSSKAELNNLPPISIILQLYDRSVEAIRIKTFQGNFDKSTAKNKSTKILDFLKSIYAEQTSRILIDNKPSIEAIEIEEPDNQDELLSPVLPSKSFVISLADYIQNKVQGIYLAGLGLYIQKFKNKKTLFIYSIYDGNKFKKSKGKLIFYIPLESSLSISEITYKSSNDVTKVLTHANSNIKDYKQTLNLNHGTGVRVSNTPSFMKKPVEVTEQGPRFNNTGLNSEFVLSDRADNLNFAITPSNPISSNLFKHVSTIRKNNEIYIDLMWSNADPDLIFPGMACQIIYQNQNKVDIIYGVVHQVNILYADKSGSQNLSFAGNSSTFSCDVLLKIFLTLGN